MPDWVKLRDETAPVLWGIAYRILNHYDDARDCLQNVYLEAIESSQTNNIKNWPGFLRWLVTRRAIDMRRRRRSFAELADSDLSQPDTNQLEIAETISIIRDELNNLPTNQAIAFWMFSVEEISGREIAQVMGISENAVRMLTHRARKHLQSKLARYYQP